MDKTRKWRRHHIPNRGILLYWMLGHGSGAKSARPHNSGHHRKEKMLPTLNFLSSLPPPLRSRHMRSPEQSTDKTNLDVVAEGISNNSGNFRMAVLPYR